MMKSIAVFNNKGGVGKTTLLCNLSSFLESKGWRVLVVDADPQCNATSYVLDPESIMSQFSFDNTIQKIFQPIKEGAGYVNRNDIPIIESSGFGIDIIVGDPKLSLMEDFLSQDWFEGRSGEVRGLKTTLIIKDLLNKLADQYDFVFFDVGPSLGAINRVVLLACDYFLMPMSTDIFSLQAVSNIAESLSTWKTKMERGLKDYQENTGAPFELNDNVVSVELRFVGYVNQQYIAKTVAGVARPVKAYDSIMSKMPQTICDELTTFYPHQLPQDRLKLGSIPNFNSLIPLSQLANKPIFALSSLDGVVGAHFSKVKEYAEVMEAIVNNLLSNIEYYDSVA